ncbi:MAG: tRNA 5-methoxyuridine(34)/uridine 5-oxyacetic acid(34) synthase CmoB [Pseudomonadota bacterium]
MTNEPANWLRAELTARLQHSPFAPEHLAFEPIIASSQINKHGDLPRWVEALRHLPSDRTATLVAATAAISIARDLAPEAIEGLRALMPWRKGPFLFGDTLIDSEWRCDLKWQRVAPHIAPLRDRRVLDVGGGNGYYAWRMHAAGAAAVLNIDPTALFTMQFLAVDRMVDCPSVMMLPTTLEALPISRPFDTVCSMGVLYHRRDPLQHLRELRQQLRSGGELVLETLVVPGDVNTCFVPEGRYARMRNVWFLPSVSMLTRWLRRTGFSEVKTVDATYTTSQEQRPTEWMTFESLADALSADGQQTIEGQQPPLRATLIATAD